MKTMLIALSLCLAGAAFAKGPKAPKGPKQGKPTQAAACPSAAQVNTKAENDRGCKGSFIPASMAAEWAPATEAAFLAQNRTSQAAANAKAGKSYPAPTRSSWVPGAGKGGIRCPKYYKFKGSRRPFNLFRVYGSPGMARKEGGWWTFQDVAWKTPAQADAYRKHYAICKSWNDLKFHVSCKLKPGTVIAAGPGQSVGKQKDAKGKCANVCANVNEKYPTDTAVQVALYNPGEFCTFGP